MPRSTLKIATILIILFLVAVVSIGPLGSTKKTQAQGTAKASTRWEYCMLYWNYQVGKVRLVVADTLTEANGMIALAKEMKASMKVGEKDEFVASVAVLNHLGNQGWELVSHTVNVDTDKDGARWKDDQYVFKRRVEK